MRNWVFGGLNKSLNRVQICFPLKWADTGIKIRNFTGQFTFVTSSYQKLDPKKTRLLGTYNFFCILALNFDSS
jgi:hypothetical protein